MTFSIVAHDDATGAFGVCGYTDIAGYGSIVPHVSRRGAVATQAYANVDNGLRVLELIEAGRSAEAAAEQVIAQDPGRDMRQLLAIGTDESRYAWSGAQTIPGKGHALGTRHVVGGNCITSEAVLDAISRAFRDGAGEEFTLRLIKAIQAGEDAGGHVATVDEIDAETGVARSRPTKEVFGGWMSAAVMVAAPEPAIWHNLRVDAHPNAIAELETVYWAACESADRVTDFYRGAIRIKPYFWRVIGETVD